MPIKKCTENGKSGWKYGDSGKCYTGPDGKKKAAKQAAAIKISQGYSLQIAKADLLSGEPESYEDLDVDNLLKNFGQSEEDKMLLIEANYNRELEKRAVNHDK